MKRLHQHPYGGWRSGGGWRLYWPVFRLAGPDGMGVCYMTGEIKIERSYQGR